MSEHQIDQEYNLVDERWIPVIHQDGSRDTVSLRVALTDSHCISALAGDTPTQNVALFRMLLAVCERAFEGPPTTTAWRELWAGVTLPEVHLKQYLEQWRPRFDLLSKYHPFMQVAELTIKKSSSPPSLLVPHWPSGNNVPLFLSMTDVECPSLSLAEAARWLIHLHSFDTSSTKSAAVGDPNASAGRSFAKEPTLGSVDIVLPLGNTLKESLLLNLVPRSLTAVLSRTPEQDLPSWERPQETIKWYKESPAPAYGPVSLYTWQSRRCRLVEREGRVTGVIITAGTPLPSNRFGRDPHMRWKLVEGGVYQPQRAQPKRLVWEGMDSLLNLRDIIAAAQTSEERLAPLALSFIRQLLDAEYLEGDAIVNIEVTSMTYGTKMTIVDDVFSDRLSLPATMLAQGNEARLSFILERVSDVQNAGRALYSFTKRIYESAGGAENGRAGESQQRLYALADLPFRVLLAEMGTLPAEGFTQRQNEWRGRLRESVLEEAEVMVDSLGPTPFGKSGKNTPVSQLLLQLKSKLNKTLSLVA